MKNAIAIEQPRGNVRQRVKWQYVSLAAGLVLAATAAVGLAETSSKPAMSDAPRSASVTFRPSLNQGGESVVFYLVGNTAQAAEATRIEEDARWIRHDNNVPELKRSVHILDASSEQESAKAYRLIDDAMAAANFSDNYPAPSFTVVDRR
jgi:hypothetical protein